MQFEMNHKVGTDYSTVNFQNIPKLGNKAWENLLFLFDRLGMKIEVYINQDRIYKFPKHITSEVLSEVIHNTCFVCGGLMKDGSAMVDQEFEFEHDIYGTIKQQVPGYAKQVKVRKCESCGHSHT